MTREEALALLKKYNKEPFHLQHAFTVEGVMRWYANELGHGGEADFWALVGLLHDVDFEQWPEQHCKKAPELLAEIGAERCVRTRGLQPRLRPVQRCGARAGNGKSVICRGRADGPCRRGRADAPLEERAGYGAFQPEEKFKDKKFAAGCSRDVIRQGAERLGWELDRLLDSTLQAMRACEDDIAAQMAAL